MLSQFWKTSWEYRIWASAEILSFMAVFIGVGGRALGAVKVWSSEMLSRPGWNLPI